MADEGGFVHLCVAHHRQYSAREKVHGVVRVRLVALAVAGQVDEDEPRLLVQGRDLLAPETAVACPAVDEHDGMVALTGSNVVDFVCAEGDEVGLAERNRIGRFGRRLPTAGGERQEQAGGGDCEGECCVHTRKFGFVSLNLGGAE